MDRRKFLKISGSLVVGGVILSVVGRGMWNMFKSPDKLFYDSKRAKGNVLLKEDEDFVSPYRRVYGFLAPDDISAMEVEGGSIYIATPNNIYVYGMSGELQTNFSTPSDLRDTFMLCSPLASKCMTVWETSRRNGRLAATMPTIVP